MHSASSLTLTYFRLWALLQLRYRWAAVALLAATIIGSLLEVLGLALLGLLLSTLTLNPSTPATMWLQRLPSSWLESGSANDQVLLVSGFCGLAFLFKNLFLALHAWFEATFVFELQAKISEQLVSESLSLDYESAAKRPPSEYISLLTSDLGSLVLHTLLPALTLLSEVVMLVAVFVFLVWSHTSVTLAVSIVLGLLGFAMIRISRNSVSRLSRRRQLLEDARVRNLQQTFGNLRDVYIYGAEGHFNGVLSRSMTDLASVYRSYQMMATGPRFVLEFALVAVLLAVIAFGLKTPGNSALIASVGVFAASGFRLLIGANRLVMSAQSIRFGHAAMARVWEALKAPQAKSRVASSQLSARAVENYHRTLRMDRVTYQYGENEPIIVGDASLVVRPGEMVGIIGKSGSGKSTVLDLLAGLRTPQSGAVNVEHRERPLFGTEQDQQQVQQVGYVGQDTVVFADTLRKNIAFGVSDANVDNQRIYEVLQQAQLAEFAGTLRQGLDTVLAESSGNLSGGQRQRLGIARALYRRCNILLLDEPTSALDPTSEVEIMNTLIELKFKIAIVLVSHRPVPIAACDRVYRLDAAQLELVTKASE